MSGGDKERLPPRARLICCNNGIKRYSYPGVVCRKICGVNKKYTDHCVCVNMLRQIKCFVLNTIRFSQSDCVADFVVGNVDMVTMEKKSTFPTQQVRTYSCIKVYKVTFWSTCFGQTLFFIH